MTQSDRVAKSDIDAAVKSFQVGDCVEHLRPPNMQGKIVEIDSRLAIPQVWVEWDNVEEKEFNPPLPYSPLDLVKAVTVTRLEELSLQEEQDRRSLEVKVERAFYESGIALRQLRDRKLYRSTHHTFEEYCRDRFNFTRAAAYYLISAASVIDNLSCQPLVDILPTNEKQCRPLSKLEPDEQREVWAKAVKKVGGKVPSGRVVEDVVETIKQRTYTKQPISVEPGQVVEVVAGSRRDIKKYNNQWGMVTAVGEYGIAVTIRGKTVNLFPDEVDVVPEADAKQWREVQRRIARLLTEDLDELMLDVLELISRRTVFTTDQLWLLEQIEKRQNS